MISMDKMSILIILLILFFIIEHIVIVKYRRKILRVLDKVIDLYKHRGVKVFFSKLKEKINFVIVSHGFKKIPSDVKITSRTISINPLSASINIHEEYNDNLVKIAFYPTGGMGDYIISAVILEELQEICKCSIDVFAEKKMFGNSIYGSRKNVIVKDAKEYELLMPEYDLAIKVGHFVHIDWCKHDRLLLLSPKLYDKVKYIQDNWEKLYVNIPEQCWRERIQFERCRLLGLNRWTELRMGKAFAVKEMKVTIPMNSLFEDEYSSTSFYNKKYITLNYGADAMRVGMKQLKLWPKEHMEEFVRLFKEKFPDIIIVQLGGGDAEKIKGVDEYVLGKNFELTKYIIKDSMCHVDCEGGLVHLAAQFDTRSVVVFGPTPVHMYGYPQNINIVSENCNNCMGLHADWAYKCYCCTGDCMEKISPERVLLSVEIILN